LRRTRHARVVRADVARGAGVVVTAGLAVAVRVRAVRVAIEVPVHATVTLPGSKSITNRALILAALADGPSTLTGALRSRDTDLMI